MKQGASHSFMPPIALHIPQVFPLKMPSVLCLAIPSGHQTWEIPPVSEGFLLVDHPLKREIFQQVLQQVPQQVPPFLQGPSPMETDQILRGHVLARAQF